MEFPFFCLTKKGRMTPMVYNDGKVKIEIKPGSSGIATIWDKDILIYCASVINDKLERGVEVDRRVVVPAYDILRICQRGTGKRSYELLLDALERLRATTIITNVTSYGEKERRGFGWIDNFRVVERDDKNGKRVMAGVEIHLNEWMFKAIVKERRVLTIDRAYFRLTMGLERRLYELARKHCGQQPKWEIGMLRLLEKCGVDDVLRNFKASLVTIINRDSLPGYRMELVFDATLPQRGVNERTVVRFFQKDTPLDL